MASFRAVLKPDRTGSGTFILVPRELNAKLGLKGRPKVQAVIGARLRQLSDPARELSENYPRLELDRRLFHQNRQFTLIGVDLYTYVESAFYPVSGPRSLLIDKVSLPPRAYMEDVLYFPVPQSGLNGVPLRLLFKVSGLDDPIQVVFEVPRTLGIFEKDKGKEDR